MENWRAGTCNPGGASAPGKKVKWQPEYSESLRSADIVIIPDHDEPGRAHAEAIAQMSTGIVKRIRVLDLAKHWPECPRGGDISDWLGAGHTRAEFDELIEQAPDWAGRSNDSTNDAWPIMGSAAYYGPAGDVVRTIEPHTEADPVAILIQFLVVFGNMIGNAPHYIIESDRHPANLFITLVGVSSKGRKGTAAGRVRAVAKLADGTWASECTAGGLSSGEGLINAVRNPIKKWNAKEKVEEVVDPGVSDKRLMVTEPEFAGALTVMERHGNTLSPVIRNAWDGLRLQTLTKNSPLKADGTHISIVGHITETELQAR